MELGLSLGDNSNSNPFELLENQTPGHEQMTSNKNKIPSGFCMDLSSSIAALVASENEKQDDHTQTDDAPVQLNLLPHTPVPRNHGFFWPCSENHMVEVTDEGAGLSSSPNSNSGTSSFQMDISLYSNYKRDNSEGEGERACSRASDEDHDTNGSTRKKLRLSKDQSAFLEESFKEHNTLNPKQKLALAKQLKLRPRQVEVWFQNRRARTKLKQTEVDCEYLKRCCEKLTEENRKLHKELQELRVLKTSNPFYKQLPATTLTMCPSCERVATTNTNTNNNTQSITTNSNSKQQQANNNNMSDSKAITQINDRPNFFPFSHSHQS